MRISENFGIRIIFCKNSFDSLQVGIQKTNSEKS